MTTTQINLLSLRNNFGKYLNQIYQNPITVTKRGKKVAVIIDPKTAEKFWQWQELEELKKLYLKAKSKFERYGKRFLKARNLKEKDLTVDEIVELVAND